MYAEHSLLNMNRQCEVKDFGSNPGSPLIGSYNLEHDTLPETFPYKKNEKNIWLNPYWAKPLTTFQHLQCQDPGQNPEKLKVSVFFTLLSHHQPIGRKHTPCSPHPKFHL